MIKELRQRFNANFTREKYDAYMAKLESLHPGALDFRNAETPIFIPKEFTAKMLGACEDIIDVIVDPRFIALTERGIPETVRVPNESSRSQFIVFDFGICENEKGELLGRFQSPAKASRRAVCAGEPPRHFGFARATEGDSSGLTNF